MKQVDVQLYPLSAGNRTAALTSLPGSPSSVRGTNAAVAANT